MIGADSGAVVDNESQVTDLGMAQRSPPWVPQWVRGSVVTALRVVAIRAGQALITLLGATIVVWTLISVAPGDPAQRVLSSRGVLAPTPAELSYVRAELGLNAPAPVRYVRWLVGALHGDLSNSYISDRPVTEELGVRIGPTLLLAGIGISMAIVFSLLAALVAAYFAGRWPDLLIRGYTVVCASVPSFVVALVLIQILVVQLGIGHALADGGIRDVWLPAFCLAVGGLSAPARVLRAGLILALDEQYSLVATARGATRRYNLLRHALPNGLVPYVQSLALAAAWMIGGAVIVEAVFNWPGVGAYAVQAVENHDLPVIQAFTLLATGSFISASLAADLISSAIDPRTRTRR